MDLDVSNDPEIERLGANATALHALEFWETLSAAARRDGREFDPLWDNNEDNEEEEGTDEKEEEEYHLGGMKQVNEGTPRRYHTQQIVLTTSLEADLRLYKRFRSNFGQLSVANLKSSSSSSSSHDDDKDDSDLDFTSSTTTTSSVSSLSPLSGARWTNLLLASEGVIPDFNFMTLLREHVMDMFWMTEEEVCDGLVLVPRAQFLFVEVTRLQEGMYRTRQFRRALQRFDVKTQSDIVRNVCKSIMVMTMNNNNNSQEENDKECRERQQQHRRALQALDLLQTQWPHASIAILKQTGVIPMVKRLMTITATTTTPTTSTVSSFHFLNPIHDKARALLQYWQDLHELGRIPKQLKQQKEKDANDNDNTHQDNQRQRRLRQQQQRIQDALQRAGQALVMSRLQSPTATTTGASTNVLSSSSSSTIATPLITKTTNSLEDITVHLTATSTFPSSSPSSLAHSSRTIFSQYGMLVLPHQLSRATVTNCQEQAQRALQELIVEQLQPRGLQVDGDNAFDYPFVRQRPGHRVDNRYHIVDDPTSPMAKLGQDLLRSLPNILFGDNSDGDGDDESVKEGGYKILYGGVVHSFPRKDASEPFPPAQLWHRDGPSLFSNHHHETHCFNVFIPLVDVTTENGTTEFIPGTHADVVFEELATQVIPLAQRDEGAQHEHAVRAFCTAGTIIAFDIRLLHRGLSNTSNQDRPVLYFTIAKDWFLEAHMFQQQQEQQQQTLLPEPTTMPPAVVDNNSHQRRLVQRLYHMITGQHPFSSSFSLPRNRSSHHHPKDPLEGMPTYGHPHYTTRFDLLLLELFQSKNDSNPFALQNLQAIIVFSSASVGDREAMTREFIYSFGEMAVQRKMRVLEAAHLARRERPAGDSSATSLQNGNSASYANNNNHNNHIDDKLAIDQNTTTLDFSTIEQDMSDVFALYKLTATILMEESVLLSKLGFTADEQGVCILLALLKANAKHSVLTKDCSIGVTAEQLEETFTSWWHACEDRFAFWQTGSDEGDDGQDAAPSHSKKLLVVFSSLGSGIARPEWCGSLSQVARELSSSLDVLHVMDPAFSWYCQDPSCQWRGGEYYMSQLSEYVRDYASVMFLGDSMGAAAALRFSELANVVLAFTPQVDISHYEAITRLDFAANVKDDFKIQVIDVVTKTRAKIDIHYGDKCEEDIRQFQILPERSNVHLIPHDFDDHILSLHLRDKGQLKGLIEGAIRSFVDK